MKDGKEAAAKLRLAIKAHFGPKSERLLQYGIKPFRKRIKKATTVTEEPEPETPTPAPHSEPTTKPA
jgi:hypothetical protein